MVQGNVNTETERSQVIYRREDAREVSPQERLSPLDQGVIGEAWDKITTEVLREHIEDDGYIEDYRSSFFQDAAIGHKRFLDLVRWYNGKYPESAILIPSDYLTNLTEVEPPDWLVPGLMLRNGLTLFYGEAGSYKTTLIIYLGHSLMTGTAFFGIPIEGNCRVLYVEQDQSLSIMKDQVQKIGYPEDIFVCCKLPVLWDGKKFNQDFYNSLEALKPDVVFIDAYTSLGIEDITRPQSALCLDALRRIANERKMSILITHHENKAGTQMGSALHVAKVDSEVQTTVTSREENAEMIMLSQGKVRGQHIEPIFLVADKNTLHIERRLNMNVAQQVRAMLSEGQDRQSILGRFRGTPQIEAARKALQRASRGGATAETGTS